MFDAVLQERLDKLYARSGLNIPNPPAERIQLYNEIKEHIIQMYETEKLCPNAKFTIAFTPEVVLSVLSHDKQIKVIHDDGYHKPREFIVKAQDNNPITYQQVINKLIEKKLKPYGDHRILERIFKDTDGIYYIWFGS